MKNKNFFMLNGAGTPALYRRNNFRFDLQRFDSAFSGGSGTENDPYLISINADLQQLANDVNNGTTYANTYFRLNADLDISSITNWTPIGQVDPDLINIHFFKGHFDGGTYDEIAAFEQDATVLDGLAVSGNRVENARNDVSDWLSGLDF